MKTQRGAVAFLDILGYQNFVDNNSSHPDKAAKILGEILPKLDEIVREGLAAQDDTDLEQYFCDEVKILSLSDSIVLHIPFEQPNDQEVFGELVGVLPAFRAMQILVTAQILSQHLFDAGFPIRGAMACGDYFSDDTSRFLIGKPFMDSYRLGQSLELSAFALDDSAVKTVEEVDPSFRDELLRRHVVRYLTPTKAGEKHLHLSVPRMGKDPGILEDLVYCAFWRHQKDIPAAVDSKAVNTIKFLRFCRVHGLLTVPPKREKPKVSANGKSNGKPLTDKGRKSVGADS